MAKNGRLLFYLIISGLICNAIYLLFEQIYMHTSKELEHGVIFTGWYYQMQGAGGVLISIASVFSFIFYRKNFPTVVNACFVIIILLILIVTYRDFVAFFKRPSLFYSPKGIGTWINFGLLYFVANEHYLKKIFKWLHFFCFVFIVYNIIRVAMLGAVSNRDDVELAIRDTTVMLIWVYPFFFLDGTDRKGFAKIMKYVLMTLVMFFAFAIASRSYMLISMIIIMVKLKRDLKGGKNAVLILFILGIVFSAGFFLTLNIQNFKSLNGLLDTFSSRIGDDSRSGQLKEFMKLYDWDKLFTGVGILGTWNWSVILHGHYEWLDNQFILISWWFGLQTLIFYLFLLIYAVFKKNEINDLKISNAKISLVFWILACGGFAIFAAVSSTLYYFYITFMVGLVTINKKYIKVEYYAGQ
jgi:hypothetical protein